MRETLSELGELLGIGRADHGTDRAVSVGSDGICAPFLTLVAHSCIERHAVDQHILKFTRGGIRGLAEDKDALVALTAYIEQRGDAVRAEIAVDGQCIRAERLIGAGADLAGAEVCRGICLHGRADVVALAVGDDIHPAQLCVADGALHRLDAVVAVHFIICSLQFHRRNNIAERVDQQHIELIDRLCGSLEGLAVFIEMALAEILRHIVELRVKTCNGRIFHRGDLRQQTVKGHDQMPPVI